MSAKRTATWYRWDDMEREVLHDAHMNEQLTYILEGALKFFVGVDVFYPPREDWLKKTDAYLRK